MDRGIVFYITFKKRTLSFGEGRVRP